MEDSKLHLASLDFKTTSLANLSSTELCLLQVHDDGCDPVLLSLGLELWNFRRSQNSNSKEQFHQHYSDLTFDLMNLSELTSSQLILVTFHREATTKLIEQAILIFMWRRSHDLEDGCELLGTSTEISGSTEPLTDESGELKKIVTKIPANQQQSSSSHQSSSTRTNSVVSEKIRLPPSITSRLHCLKFSKVKGQSLEKRTFGTLWNLFYVKSNGQNDEKEGYIGFIDKKAFEFVLAQKKEWKVEEVMNADEPRWMLKDVSGSLKETYRKEMQLLSETEGKINSNTSSVSSVPPAIRSRRQHSPIDDRPIRSTAPELSPSRSKRARTTSNSFPYIISDQSPHSGMGSPLRTPTSEPFHSLPTSPISLRDKALEPNFGSPSPIEPSSLLIDVSSKSQKSGLPTPTSPGFKPYLIAPAPWPN